MRFWRQLLLPLIVCTRVEAQDDNTVIIRPYNFRPSGSWDGPDGPWASFEITTGYDGNGNGQTFRTFPALSFPIVLVPVAADFCEGNASHPVNENCAARNTFDPRASDDLWQPQGEIDVLSALGLSRFVDGNLTVQNDTYGLNNVALGDFGPTSIAFQGQAVAGTASKEFFMGLFGLSVTPVIWGEGKMTTLLENLKHYDQVPSRSFSYTAGSSVRNSFPSLVFGGYDTTRFQLGSTMSADVSDTSHPFPVTLTSITFSESQREWHDTSVGSPGYITVYIDSATPYIWLPISVCEVFEDVFGITWNETAQYYLVNDTTHKHMLQMNSSVTFTLQASRSGKDLTNFTLPYTAFALEIDYPLLGTKESPAPSPLRYFPLKRTSRPDQYILGRTFLQETHISVDYDSGYFNLSQATTAEGEPNIVPILPLNVTSRDSRNANQSSGQKGLSSGSYAGIGVGIGALAIAIITSLILWRKGLWPFRGYHAHTTETGQDQYGKAELHGGENRKAPLVEAMDTETMELETNEPSHEVSGLDSPQHTIEGLNLVHEMSAEDRRA